MKSRISASVLLLATMAFSAGPSFAQSQLDIEGIQLPALPGQVPASTGPSNAPPQDAPAPSARSAQTGTQNPSGRIPRSRNYTFGGRAGDASLEMAPKSARKALHLQMEPGNNEIVTISRGNLNRIVTPFEEPIVRTVSDAEIQREKNVVYVATNSEEVIGLFIKDASASGPAMSLSLLPRSIPPREINLAFSDETTRDIQRHAPVSALPVETQSEYTEAITDVLVTLASQEVPRGYRLAEPTEDDHVEFFCMLPASSVELIQVAEGGRWRVGISRVRNNSDVVIEYNENDCQSQGSLAYSMYPSAVLEPGEEAEFYTVRARHRPAEQNARFRPSIINR